MNKLIQFLNISLLLGFMACGGSSSSEDSSSEETVSTEIPAQAINIKNKDVLIHHTSCGEGDITLLFVHGWCINQTYWKEQIETLCENYKVVAIDLPGFGESGKNRQNWTIEAYAEDLGVVIDQLNLKNVVLIGHSMGGDVVLETALNREEVIALIGVDNFKTVGMEFNEASLRMMNEFIAGLKVNYTSLATDFARGSLFHESTDSAIIDRVITDVQQADSVISVAALENLFAYAPQEPEKLAQLKQPFYFINSDATPTDKEALEATGVTYKVVDIPATGHYPMVEKPELFTQLLTQTLEEIKSSH